MILHRSNWILLGFVAASAVACSSSDSCIPYPVEAPTLYRPAVVVGVSDSVTGKPIADSAYGTISSPSASDSLLHGWYQQDSILVSTLGPGWYTVTVQHPGYLTWVRKTVIVKRGNCGSAVSVDLTARLQRGP